MQDQADEDLGCQPLPMEATLPEPHEPAASPSKKPKAALEELAPRKKRTAKKSATKEADPKLTGGDPKETETGPEEADPKEADPKEAEEAGSSEKGSIPILSFFPTIKTSANHVCSNFPQGREALKKNGK